MIYADNAATTKMTDFVIEKMTECMKEIYGNPSSIHSVGVKALKAKEDARKNIAFYLNALPEEIIFTSGGSESDNQAIQTGMEYGIENNKFHIISQKTEHHAILNTLKAFENIFEITLLDVDSDGMVSPDQVRKVIRKDTALVSIMTANNEIGTIQPIKEIAKICRENGALFHTDAVQAVGHIPIDVKDIGCDMLSFSAHKFHGAKGVGGLYVRKGINLKQLIRGGSQERGNRAGTENIPGIVAMSHALAQSVNNACENTEKIIKMRDRLIEGLLEIPCSVLNGSKTERLPGNVSMCFDGIEGESLVLMLDIKGICASSGSACTSGSLEPSHVLTAIGRPEKTARGALRLSISEDNTPDEIEYIIKTVTDTVKELREMSPDYV